VKPASYPCPLPGGEPAGEYALTFDQSRNRRILIAPALFDEGHKLRRFTVEVMRRLDGAGIDSFLPDLPGLNESEQDLALIEPEDWRMALEAAARHFGATHVLALRGGGLVLPGKLGGWHYGPVKGASLLRTMLRARIIAAREAGREELLDTLMDQGLAMGLELAGYSLSGEMLRQLGELVPGKQFGITVIEHELLGDGPLWLRAEPDEDSAQADALAAIVAIGIAA
jgi:hypothetical protein